jgi:predicted O-methyltransferase YrrM
MSHPRAWLEAIKYSPLGRVATLPLRMRAALPPLGRQSLRTLAWVASSKEWSNFSAHYSDEGRLVMATAIAHLTQRPLADIRGFALELAEDEAFHERVRARKAHTALKHITNPGVPLGKCLFNHVLVRATGARQVFEAGTDQGLSTWAMCRALARNARDRREPLSLYRLSTIDLHADRSLYLQGDEGGLVERLSGDSVQALRQDTAPLDLILHDTVNEDTHTREQLAAAAPRLAPGGMLHTSWFNAAFVDACLAHGLACLPVAERLQNHWFEGRLAGIARKPPGEIRT